MANSTPPFSPPAQPAVDPLAAATADFVAAQQAFVAAQQAKANAQNDSLLAGAAAATTLNVTLDPDLSALFNDPSVQSNNAYKAVIAVLQTVRLAQQAAGLLAAILAKLGTPPAPQPEPSVQVQSAASSGTTTNTPQT